LIIASSFLSLNGAEVKAFLVVIQLGAILAVCWHQKQIIYQTLKELPKKKSESFAVKILAAFVPTACIGLVFYDLVKTFLFSPISVSLALILGGVLIITVENKNQNSQDTRLENITIFQAIKIGFFQSIAIFPGVSRSGATIIGGLTLGLSRKTATLFSCLPFQRCLQLRFSISPKRQNY
jgi:undecaprenyl-diphosphatase